VNEQPRLRDRLPHTRQAWPDDSLTNPISASLEKTQVTMTARLYGRDPLASRMAGHSQASGTLDETPTIGVFDVDSKLCRSTI
jgi:hypothetical protein